MPYALDYLGTRSTAQRLPLANRWALVNYSVGYGIQSLLNTGYPTLFASNNTVQQQRDVVAQLIADSVASTLPNALIAHTDKIEWMSSLWFHLMQLPPPRYASVGGTILNFGSSGNPTFIEA
jgi:hypothetical protein